jgi:hypothetical protein
VFYRRVICSIKKSRFGELSSLLERERVESEDVVCCVVVCCSSVVARR